MRGGAIVCSTRCSRRTVAVVLMVTRAVAVASATNTRTSSCERIFLSLAESCKRQNNRSATHRKKRKPQNATMNRNSLKVKVYFSADDIRRCTLSPVSFAALASFVPQGARLYYRDDDGDIVTLACDAELAEACACAVRNNTLSVAAGDNGKAALARAPSALDQSALAESVVSSPSGNASPLKAMIDEAVQSALAASLARSPVPASPVPASPVPAPAEPRAAPASEPEQQPQPQPPQPQPQPPQPYQQIPSNQYQQQQQQQQQQQYSPASIAQQQDARHNQPAFKLDAARRGQESAHSWRHRMAQQRAMRAAQQSLSDEMRHRVDQQQYHEQMRQAQAQGDNDMQRALALSMRAYEEEERKRVAERAAADRKDERRRRRADQNANAPLFASMFDNSPVAGNNGKQELENALKLLASNMDVAEMRPLAQRFLRDPSDAAAEPIKAHIRSQYNASNGNDAVSDALLDHVLDYIRERPHVREFLAQLLESASLASLVTSFVGGSSQSSRASNNNSSNNSSNNNNGSHKMDVSLVASYRDEVRQGRILCDECHKVVSGARYKCAICDDFDLCSFCEPTTKHDPDHALLKIRPSKEEAADDAAMEELSEVARQTRRLREAIQNDPTKIANESRNATELKRREEAARQAAAEQAAAEAAKQAAKKAAEQAAQVAAAEQAKIEAARAAEHERAERERAERERAERERAERERAERKAAEEAAARAAEQERAERELAERKAAEEAAARAADERLRAERKAAEEAAARAAEDERLAAVAAQSLAAADNGEADMSASMVRGHRATLVRDVTLVDGTRVRPGASLTKVWRLQNSGSMPWPENVTLGFVGGSAFDALPTQVPPCAAGEVVDVTLRCTAPDRPGHYVGYWRLLDMRGQPFGERIWLDVQVIAPEKPAAALEQSGESAAAASEHVSNSESNINNNSNNNTTSPVVDAAVLRSVVASEQQAQSESTQDEAAEHVVDDEKAAMRVLFAEKLKQLRSMGFGDDDLNIALLQQHGGNVLRVVDELISRL